VRARSRRRRPRGPRSTVLAGVEHVLNRLSSWLPGLRRQNGGGPGDSDRTDQPQTASPAPLPLTGSDEEDDVARAAVGSDGEGRVASHDGPEAENEDDAAVDRDSAEDQENSDSDVEASDGGTTSVAGFRWAIIVCTLVAAALGGVIGYFAHQTQVIRETAQRDNLFFEAGRQAALNLTTISYTDVDRDVARVLDSATGSFHDDFQNRSGPFIAVVKQAQSTSRGTITEAGLSSVDGDQAQVIVAVSVTTSIAGQSNDDQPRGWRMRLNVQKVGDSAKVSDVQFVP
jgi:Mce-associated membrane protein